MSSKSYYWNEFGTLNDYPEGLADLFDYGMSENSKDNKDPSNYALHQLNMGNIVKEQQTKQYCSFLKLYIIL